MCLNRFGENRNSRCRRSHKAAPLMTQPCPSKGTTRKRRNARIWRGVSNIKKPLVIRKVPRPRYWAASLLYFAGIPGEDLGIYPGGDLVQIYQNQSSCNNSKILKRIEDRLRRIILSFWEEVLELYPDQVRRRLMKQSSLPLKKG